MDEKITLKKVNIVGNLYYHVFQNNNDSTFVKVETTEEEYKNLNKKNPFNPTMEGFTWKYSFGDYKYDTQSGKLEEGKYADNGDGYRAMVGGVDICNLKKVDIVNNEVSLSKVDSLVVEINKLSDEPIK